LSVKTKKSAINAPVKINIKQSGAAAKARAQLKEEGGEPTEKVDDS